jgi:saccharopine dehydrogenase (NAD+, L-lysine-forming)
MGRVTVTDLARSPDVDEVRIVERDEEGARALAATLGGPVGVAAAANGYAEALRGVDAVVNAASHRLNLEIMEACLDADAHYTDLGGLFHWALRQYDLDERFREKGLGAAISMGSAPGLTNMLAAACCERLDTVESIDIVDAFMPGRELDPDDPYVPPYAASTIIDEFTEPAMIFVDGELREVPAGSGATVVEFPDGAAECVYTIHSESSPCSRGRRARSTRPRTQTRSSGSA